MFQLFSKFICLVVVCLAFSMIVCALSSDNDSDKVDSACDTGGSLRGPTHHIGGLVIDSITSEILCWLVTKAT